MDVVELTRDLVRIRSLSGNEEGCVELLRAALPGAQVSGRNVFAIRGDGPRTLLLNSHTDTVPDSAEWTIDPFAADMSDGKIFGLGANDAKGPLAALVCAFLVAELPDDARVILAATCEEETGGEGLGVLRPELPDIDAAIIGEPTGMAVCSCQRGLLRLRLHARGKSAHASRPWQGTNAIEISARDIGALAALELPEHALLGPATLQATVIMGGVRTNVVPPECTVEIDARTIPALDNETLRKRVCETVESDVELVSDRFVPLETPTAEAVVQAALLATGNTEPIAFGGVSDFFHVRDVPGIVMGPGRSDQSHAANEWIEVEQLKKGVTQYRETIERFFA